MNKVHLVAGYVGSGKSKILFKKINESSPLFDSVVTVGLEYNSDDIAKVKEKEKLTSLKNIAQLEDLVEKGLNVKSAMLVIDNISMHVSKEKMKSLKEMGFKRILVHSQLKRNSTAKEDGV